MRIVAGRFRGRRLAEPSDQAIRPTSDRVREAVFNILRHGLPGFEHAGTGALGFEAISQGAADCLFVEEAAEARGLIRETIEALGLTGQTRIFRRDATALGPAGRLGPFTLVFADPPYGRGLGERALAAAIEGGWLAEGAVVVLEERADALEPAVRGLVELDRRIYGDTKVRFFRSGVSGTTGEGSADATA
ncbi:MAG: 16S rRNA (guanine(966)-N(2))-methyltransferase RsmD [Hyphomicrobiaceae bacterium]